MDKTVLEAMACKTFALVSSDAFKDILPEICIFKEGNAQDLADKINGIMSLPDRKKQEYGEQLRKCVVERHSLRDLAEQLKHELS